MKNLVVAMAVGAAALIGGTAAQASDKGETGAQASQSTDISARGRHHHHGYHHHWRGHHWRQGYYRPYGNSYGYYRGPSYGYPSYGYGHPYGYYGGGPGVTFSFGSGRW